MSSVGNPFLFAAVVSPSDSVDLVSPARALEF